MVMRIESIFAHQFVTVVYYPQFTHWFRCPRRAMRRPFEASVQLRFLLSWFKTINGERNVEVGAVTLKVRTGYHDSGSSTYKLILTASSHSLLSKTPCILGRAATLSASEVLLDLGVMAIVCPCKRQHSLIKLCCTL